MRLARNVMFLTLPIAALTPACDSDLLRGDGPPAIRLTYVPERGSFDNLEGRVEHVIPREHRVAVYILVGRGWWTKPTFASPLTHVRDDGTFATDITTGGIDETASAIAVYLVPVGYEAPAAAGARSLPAELAQDALAAVQVVRR